MKDELLLQESDAPQPNPAVLLIDLSSIAHPIWHVSQAEPDPDHTSQRTAAVVRNLAADHPHTAICCDSGASFRKDIDPTYKANRPVSEAALHHQIALAREALEADGFPVWRVGGFEGDDLIATATARITEHSRVSVLIASADKDLLALVSEQVEVHSTRTGNRIGPPEVMVKMGVGPHLIADYLTLVGDASDNIKGAKGIGPKTAADILGFFGSLDAVYSAIDAGSVGSLKPAQLASLDELRPRLEAVRQLVRMRTDVPLDIAAVFQPRVPTVVEDFMEEDEMENEALTAAESVDTLLDEVRRKNDEARVLLSKTRPELGPAATVAQTVYTIEQAEKAGLLLPGESEPGPRIDTRLLALEESKPEPVKPTHNPRIPLPPEEPKPAAAVAVVEQPAPDEWERSLEPRSMHEACLLAKRLHQSHMFDGYGSPQAVLSTVLLGRELGLPAMASLRSVHLIEGKHSLSAELMVALVLKSGLAEHFTLIESTDKVCTYETKRLDAPGPQRLSYTIEQAATAGLLAPPRPNKQPGPWHRMPDKMLRARAKSELARLEYPDLLAGLYTPEELRDAKNGS